MARLADPGQGHMFGIVPADKADHAFQKGQVLGFRLVRLPGRQAGKSEQPGPQLKDQMKQRIVQALLTNLRTWIEVEENPMYSQICIEFYERLRRL